MPKNKIIIVLGIIVAVLPLLGFPTSWERIFQVLVGLSIVGLSTWSTIDKRLTMKVRAQKRAQYRKAQSELTGESAVAPDAEPNLSQGTDQQY